MKYTTKENMRDRREIVRGETEETIREIQKNQKRIHETQNSIYFYLEKINTEERKGETNAKEKQKIRSEFCEELTRQYENINIENKKFLKEFKEMLERYEKLSDMYETVYEYTAQNFARDIKNADF